MKPITFILCAAGAGMRMKEISTNIPKPLLKLKSKTLLEWSIESLEIQDGDQLIVIHSFDMPTNLKDKLRLTLAVNMKIDYIQIERLTSGQAETALIGLPLAMHDRIVIYNSDTYFEQRNLRSLLEGAQSEGIIPCANAPGQSWSFCEPNQESDFPSLRRVTEKIRVSNWCSVGYYYFKNKQDLIEAYNSEQYTSQERYVAPLYNFLIQKGKDVRGTMVDSFQPMGTPEQVEIFWKIPIDDFKNENS